MTERYRLRFHLSRIVTTGFIYAAGTILIKFALALTFWKAIALTFGLVMVIRGERYEHETTPLLEKVETQENPR